MLIHHTIFYCELFSWFIFLAECEILNFANVGRRRRTASLHGWPLSVERLDTAGHVNFFYLNILFYQY